MTSENIKGFGNHYEWWIRKEKAAVFILDAVLNELFIEAFCGLRRQTRV